MLLTENKISISDNEFIKLRDFIYAECGIMLAETKKYLLYSRLLKRLETLNMHAFAQYYSYISSEEGKSSELVHMFNAVTTNKTDFFRTPDHFDILQTKILPEVSSHANEKKLRVWSAGCSTGEEPYSIAMVLAEFFKDTESFSILATDISTKALQAASQAIYKIEQIEPVPLTLKKQYLLKGKGPLDGYCKIIPDLHKKIEFKWHNLKEPNVVHNWVYDIIFCRNVAIYFDKKSKTIVFSHFFDILKEGGFLFIGNSETLYSIHDSFEYIAPGVYQKR